jgi:hypothetical protein
MTEFEVPVTWERCGWVKVKAESMEKALKDFDPQAHALPSESEYVEGSFQLTTDDPEIATIMQPPKS